jgi:cytochrome c oxidase subunit II
MKKRMARRELLLAGAALAVGSGLGGSLGGGLGRALAQGEPRVIELVARRFVYEPNEVTLKVGEPVVIAVRALDFVHGMNIPDLGQRFDLVPGMVTRIELQPKVPGVIAFVCDNFCGEGHEQMHGRFVVKA